MTSSVNKIDYIVKPKFTTSYSFAVHGPNNGFIIFSNQWFQNWVHLYHFVFMKHLFVMSARTFSSYILPNFKMIYPSNIVGCPILTIWKVQFAKFTGYIWTAYKKRPTRLKTRLLSVISIHKELLRYRGVVPFKSPWWEDPNQHLRIILSMFRQF